MWRNRKVIDEEFLEEGANGVSEEDIQDVIANQGLLEEKSRSGPLARFFEDIVLLGAMLMDFFSGEYRHVPVRTVLAVVFTLAYVIDPIDLIPDFIPVVGYMDDAAVVSMLLWWARGDVDRYRLWKSQQDCE